MTNGKWENPSAFRLLASASAFCGLLSAFCFLDFWVRRCCRRAFLIGAVDHIRLVDIERAFAADAYLLWDCRGLEPARFDSNFKPVAGQLSVCRVVDVAFLN